MDSVVHKFFRFILKLDQVLFRMVQTTATCVAVCGSSKFISEETLLLFISSSQLNSTKKESGGAPTAKSLSDRLNKLIGERKSAKLTKQNASGILEFYKERKQLLDDLISQIGKKLEKERAEKGTRARRETELFEAGEELRTSSLKRLGGDLSGEEEVETPRKKKKLGFEM